MENITEKKKINVFGMDIWKIFAYFITFCIAGFLLETMYAFVTKGTVESRRGFVYGPFCPIYGLGGVVMAVFLQYFKKNNFTIFLGGALIGSIVEYLISFIGEYVFNVKWWDYSYMTFHINGRICLVYSIIWGLLAIPFMKFICEYIDNFIEIIEKRWGTVRFKKVTAMIMFFLLVDGIATVFALRIFSDRLVYTYDLDVANKDEVVAEYERIVSNDKIKYVTEKLFSNEKILRTYPNLTIGKQDGTTVYVSSLVTTVTTYYYKLKPSDETIMYKLSKIREKIMSGELFVRGK